MSHPNVIIIGGGLTGLVTAYTAQSFGFNPVILEKTPHLGGGNRSVTENGHTFDNGYHTLDYNRSKVTTQFFEKMLDGRVRKIELKRAIVVKDCIIPYNAAVEKWPSALRELFPARDLVDNINENRTFSALSSVYGEAFVKLVTDDVLQSYPSKKWAIDQGGLVEDHIDFVYPWFFPSARKTVQRANEWEIYHDKMRETTQHVLYPSQGGFDEFLIGIEKKVRSAGGRIVTDCKDLEFGFRTGDAFFVESVRAKGETFRAPTIFWCAPLPQLFKALNLPLEIEGRPQKLVLGDFVFESGALKQDYHEILVGSLAHLINRISFPGKIAGRKEDTVQIEFYYPDGAFKYSSDEWKEAWLKSLRVLGLVGEQTPQSFRFREEYRGFATKAPFDTVADELKRQLSQIETNMIFPFPMVGPENINRLVPEAISNVTSALNSKGNRS